MSQPQYQQMPQPQYQQMPPPGYQATTSSNVVVQQPTTVVITGGCRACGGVLEDNFTICGVILAIVFFPIGLLCCFLMMEKRCSRCGAHYS